MDSCLADLVDHTQHTNLLHPTALGLAALGGGGVEIAPDSIHSSKVHPSTVRQSSQACTATQRIVSLGSHKSVLR